MADILAKTERKLTVSDLKKLFNLFKNLGKLTDTTEVWLSSDEEGNSHSPLMRFKGGMMNVGVEKDGSRITLYPSSMHDEC